MKPKWLCEQESNLWPVAYETTELPTVLSHNKLEKKGVFYLIRKHQKLHLAIRPYFDNTNARRSLDITLYCRH